MKKIILPVILLILFISTTVSVSAISDVSVTIGGKPISFTTSSGIPFIDSSNRVQVPLRAAMEALGASLAWDGKQATVTMNNIVVRVPINEKFIYVNGKQVSIDTSAMIKDNRTYLPIRPVIEAFGGSIGWNQSSLTVSITAPIPNTNIDTGTNTNINPAYIISNNTPISSQTTYATEIKVPVAKYQNKFYFLSEGYDVNDYGEKFELSIYKYNNSSYFSSNLNVFYRLQSLLNGNYSKIDYNFGNPNIDGTIYLDRNEKDKEVVADYSNEYDGINQTRYTKQTITFDNGNSISVTYSNNNPVTSFKPDNLINEVPFRYSSGEMYTNKIIDLNVAFQLAGLKNINVFYSEDLKCNVFDLD